MVQPDALPILLHGRLRRRRSQPQYVRPVRDEPFLYVPADDRSELEVPSVGPAWNKLVQDGRGSIGNTPIVKKDAAIYRTMCNVAKMNAGRNRLILIDSYNKYNFDSFIEPTVEGYGNGYGKTYLQITREQFKKN